jgi:hypothetical protein
MDNDYNSYGYSDYRADKNKDDSYGYSDYGIDKYKKPYGTDSYKSQYSYHEPDYKPKHLSYDKHDKRDKFSKDSSKSVSINNLKCVNTNININGNNTGDINIGNKGSIGGYLGASSYSGSGYGGGGYEKQNKVFDCVINNNNTNTNIVAGGDGNVIEPTATLNVTKTRTCNPIPVDSQPAAQYCNTVENTIVPSSFNITVTGNNPNPSEFVGSNLEPVIVTLGAGDYELTEELPNLPPPPFGVTVSRTTTFEGDCADVNPIDPESIVAAGTIEAGESQTCNIDNLYEASTMAGVGLIASNINTDTSSFDINTSGGIASSLSSLPTMAQGTTEDDLSAMEKITKLKTQWLNQLP